MVLLILSYSSQVMGNGAICLQDSVDIEVKGNLTAEVRVFKTFEITSEAGAGLAEVTIPINDFIEIDNIKGHTILPDGRKFKVKSSDIRTASAAEIREFGGYRIVMISLRSPLPGSRLHYEYRLKIKSLLYLPKITREYKYAVNRFAVRTRWHGDVDLQYNYGGFVMRRLGDRDLVFWAENLHELSSEPNSCPDEIFLMLSAEQFKYGKSKYRSETWPDVGRFFQARAKQSADALDGISLIARRLISTSSTLDDSIRTIFDYVADSVSYVSLELGKSDFDPHSCDLISRRGFGDCKDQSVLLSALYRSLGFDAYPALVATGDFPILRDLHPWPSFFDHVVVAIKIDNQYDLLDPSDPEIADHYLPASLRGKYYLIADGISGLQRTSSGPQPSEGIYWSFNVDPISDNGLSAGFQVEYINDMAGKYRRVLNIDNNDETSSAISGLLRESGWHLSTAEVLATEIGKDSLAVAGNFFIDSEDMGLSDGIAIGSPILVYLLDNVLPTNRKSDYCEPSSIYLEESARINLPGAILAGMEEHSEVWIRDGLEFIDEVSFDGEAIDFHRSFNFDGGIIGAEDYNEVRDYLLSIRNQRYVLLRK